MPGENIKVAVRLRGFNEREKALNSKCVVEMNGNTTIIKNPIPDGSKDSEKKFAFDYSYWSFDGYKVEPDGYFAPDGPGSKYCDQKRVFNDLGLGILKNAFDGYNSSIFAYGQTGSGKSYSIIGPPANKGLVPQVCGKIFNDIEEKKKTNPDDQFEVTFSMIEIYNEAIRDLLDKKGAVDRKGLQLHEKPGRGFHILEKDLKPTQVINYSSIEKLMEQGNANKSIAETKMNATSSRAHTIVELVFKQTFKNEIGNVMQRVSVIDLVDLAGSERSDKTGATGDRLKEGIAINLSLTSLGNVIAALASQAGGQANVRVPYRDSTLTKLLMNALGGNSKTIMIAAISPSDNNYAETLSTLRYADRAKQIKCNAKVNEDPKDKLIRELQEEILKLKGMVSGGVMPDLSQELSKKEYDKVRKEMEENMRMQIEQNEKEMEQMKLTYEQRLAEALAKAKEIDSSNVNEKAKICPHLSNINIDPMLTGSLKYLLEFPDGKDKLVVGSGENVDIQVHGLGVSDKHAVISLENSEFFVQPLPNSRIMRNGKQQEEKFQLNNFDRLVFGASLYYLFVNPSKFEQDSEAVNTQLQIITVEKIHQEIAEQTGLIHSFDHRKPDELQCINELIDLMPLVEEANQMSILLDKKMRYDLMILNPLVIGDPHSKPRPMVTVRKFGTTLEWLWTAQKFIDMKAIMSELYLDFKEDGKIDNQRFKQFDPFIDAEDEPVLCGTAVVEPRCILHRVPLDEAPKVFDYSKKLVGSLHVELLACDKQGIVFDNIEKAIIHNPEKDLKELYFLVRINNVKCLSPKFKKVFCQYKVYGDENYTKTECGKDSNTSNIKHTRMVQFPSVEPGLIKYYSTYPLFIQFYGVQVSQMNDSKKLHTREWFAKEKADKYNSVEKLREELNKLNVDLDRARGKLKNLEALLDFAEQKKKKKKIRIDYVRECLMSTNPNVLTVLFDAINKSNEKD